MDSLCLDMKRIIKHISTYKHSFQTPDEISQLIFIEIILLLRIMKFETIYQKVL